MSASVYFPNLEPLCCCGIMSLVPLRMEPGPLELEQGASGSFLVEFPLGGAWGLVATHGWASDSTWPATFYG